MAFIRLDKLLSQRGEYTRSEAGKLIRSGAVTVGGQTVRDPAHKLEPQTETVLLNGSPVEDEPFQYILFHKPAGILTAARDSRAQTVMDLLPVALRRRNVMPVGRLDKDTTGLLLLTNDGVLAHQLLSPKRHVVKEYLATVDGPLTPEDVTAFSEGLVLSDFTAKPAELMILTGKQGENSALVRVTEGKYHQVKRMFAACGRQVLTLHRQAFGPLRLDIAVGQYRALSMEERTALHAATQG